MRQCQDLESEPVCVAHQTEGWSLNTNPIISAAVPCSIEQHGGTTDKWQPAQAWRNRHLSQWIRTFYKWCTWLSQRSVAAVCLVSARFTKPVKSPVCFSLPGLSWSPVAITVSLFFTLFSSLFLFLCPLHPCLSFSPSSLHFFSLSLSLWMHIRSHITQKALSEMPILCTSLNILICKSKDPSECIENNHTQNLSLSGVSFKFMQMYFSIDILSFGISSEDILKSWESGNGHPLLCFPIWPPEQEINKSLWCLTENTVYHNCN